MAELLITLAVLAYSSIGLFAARRIYSAMRANQIEKYTYSTYDREDAAANGVLAFIVGILWPLIIPVAIVIWKPRKTDKELKNELVARERRIRELERELDIR